jgi:hypothetical protein
MAHDASAWRSSDDYDRLDALTASDLAWECLRRNDDYAADYATVSRSGPDRSVLTERLARTWGLRFPGRSRDRGA